ncbi:hypothetical protein ACFY7H_12895 [Streptomyces sp. NPDC012794]|uniref:hypothetical protein n=1 Tax=Streptomyces sp. NPDC012794 TaxID=3364850 RepID=UPI0036CDDC4C
MPTTDAFGQGIQISSLTDPPNAALMAQNLAAVVPQTVMRFASAAARNAALTSPVAGMTAWVTAEGLLTVYNGSAWAGVATTVKPMFIGKQTITQSVGNTLWAPLSMDSEILDTHGGHSTITNNTRYTCQVAGWYDVRGRAAFANNNVGARGARIHLNGSFIQGAANLCSPGNLAGVVEVNHILYLGVGDYVEVAGGQNSGGSLSTAYSGEAGSMLYVTYLAA